jgi:hypothetical protein
LADRGIFNGACRQIQSLEHPVEFRQGSNASSPGKYGCTAAYPMTLMTPWEENELFADAIAP